MIQVTPDISIDEKDISFDFVRGSGPGGQNVNKVASCVQLRYNLAAAVSLPEEVKQRLHSLARSRITEEGVLIIEAKRYRTQEQNREDAIARLVVLVFKAAEKPKVRRKTRPSVTSSAARVGAKKQRGELKRLRHYDPDEWE